MKTENKELRIANCRGKKPVVREITKARKMLNDLLIEINECDGRDDIKKCVNILWEIIESNKQ